MAVVLGINIVTINTSINKIILKFFYGTNNFIIFNNKIVKNIITRLRTIDGINYNGEFLNNYCIVCVIFCAT